MDSHFSAEAEKWLSMFGQVGPSDGHTRFRLRAVNSDLNLAC
ncbi:MAG: hypothetical protein ACYTF9_02125 [Planctomycetota bacterium]